MASASSGQRRDGAKEDKMTAARKVRKEQAFSAVSSIAPPGARGSAPPDAALMLYAKVVGLPADHIDAYLTDFRDTYAEVMRQIPEGSRRPPGFRIGCEVLRHVAFAVEEPQLQRWFACLLATASDAENSDKAHPCFAAILAALTSEEVCTLLAMNAAFPWFQPSPAELGRLRAYLRAESPEALSAGLSNLQRLGLLQSAPADADARLSISDFGKRFLYACLSCTA
jgi:hypothetical protein